MMSYTQYFVNLEAWVNCLLHRWNRLENLLVQGRKDRDFNAKDALQPVLKLLLGPDGEVLRDLVIKEAIQVTEAVVVGSVIESYKLVPDLIRTLIFNVNGNTSPFVMNTAEQESMMELRAQVFRIWELLRSSDNFDPSIFQPILQVRIWCFYLCNSCTTSKGSLIIHKR